MKIRTIDSSGLPVEFHVADSRVVALDRHLRQMLPALDSARPLGTARDGDPLFHTIGQLTWLEREALTKMYEPLIYEQVLGECITSEAGAWASTVDYESVDYTGRGQRISPTGKNMPFADVVTNKTSMAVAEGGIAYSYTLHDLEVAARGILPLPASKQEAAVIGYRTHQNDVGLIGESASNYTGLLNNGNVPNGTRPSGAVWDAATPDTILSDINAGLSNVYTNSKQNVHARRILLPPSRFQRLMQKIPNSDSTIMKFVMENNLMTVMTSQKLEIMSGGTNLETLGASSSKRAVFYTPKREYIKMHIPMTIVFGTPQPDMNQLVVPSRYRYAGVDVRQAFTAYYMDGL